MRILCLVIVIYVSMSVTNKSQAQGPPITADKPLMLGGKTKLIKTLTEYRKSENGEFISMPLMFHYLPTSSTLVGVHLPYVNYSFNDGNNGSTLGDASLLLKYQFYRKDQMGKTFRVVAKTLQTLPTGKALDIDGMSIGEYQSYQGIVAGYESIKYGISNELGYNFIPENDKDELRYKLGFGLPLLKPVYPVKQINLFFEYQNSWFTETSEFLMLFAQGIQYAKGRLTIETAIQVPLVQNFTQSTKRDQIEVMVEGLGCPFCAYGLEKKFKEFKGIKDVKIEMETGQFTFTYPSEKQITLDQIEQKVEDAGYTAVATEILRIDGTLEKTSNVPAIAADEGTMVDASFFVAGNCGMCKARIEKTAKKVPGVGSAEWDKETKQLKLSYDPATTNLEAVSSAIAISGHDTKTAKADDKTYDKLPGCCHYDRVQ